MCKKSELVDDDIFYQKIQEYFDYFKANEKFESDEVLQNQIFSVMQTLLNPHNQNLKKALELIFNIFL